MDPLLLVALLAVTVAGLAFYAFRLTGQLRAAETRLATADERVSQAELQRLILAEVSKERDAAREEAAMLRPVAERCAKQETDLVTLRAEKETLAAAKAAFERGEAERAQAYETQLKQIKDLEVKLETRFGDLAGKAVETAHDAFLKRTAERMTIEGQQNEAKLKALLQPFEATLKSYKESADHIEKARVGSYAELNTLVAQLSQGNETVSRETQRLTNVLRSSPKARGRWGEEQLRTILESAGLAENVDFALQASVSDGERQLRPDCVIRLPGDRVIVIDVKCPLVAFEQAFDEEDEIKRSDLLLKHAEAMQSYATDLGRKGYWRQFDLSPEFVIMFVPGEHFLSAAAERAPDIIGTAFKNGVIIASTINMLALAKVMAGMWRQESLAAQAREIGEAGRELYKRLSVMAAHVSRLGKNLSLANGAYNDFVGSLEGQVYTQARRFETLGVDTGGRKIEAAPMIESSPRPLTKLVANTTEEAA